MRSLLTLGFFAVVGCHRTHTTAATIDPSASALAKAAPSPSATKTDEPTPATSTPYGPIPFYVPDGTFIVAWNDTLVAHAPGGAVARRPLAKGEWIALDPLAAHGVVVLRSDSATLLATPTLAVLYEGAFRAAGSGWVVTSTEILLQHGTRLLRLSLPADFADNVIRVDEVAGGTRINVTYETPLRRYYGTALYDEGGTLLGLGIPLLRDRGEPGAGAVANTVGFAVRGHLPQEDEPEDERIVRVDLRTGKVEREGAVLCAGEDERRPGNLTASATGDLLFATCGGGAGFVIDGSTLHVRRRIANVRRLPFAEDCASDNLGATMLADGHTLSVPNPCDGTEWRIDLATDRVTCGDPSESNPHPGVPRCNPKKKDAFAEDYNCLPSPDGREVACLLDGRISFHSRTSGKKLDELMLSDHYASP